MNEFIKFQYSIIAFDLRNRFTANLNNDSILLKHTDLFSFCKFQFPILSMGTAIYATFKYQLGLDRYAKYLIILSDIGGIIA